jgi:hypothetical protein
MFGFKGSLFLGIFLSIFTIPLYRWLLHDYSILVALPLGFVFACIIHRYSVINIRRNYRQMHRRHDERSRRNSSGQIHVDRYGRVNDPDD